MHNTIDHSNGKYLSDKRIPQWSLSQPPPSPRKNPTTPIHVSKTHVIIL